MVAHIIFLHSKISKIYLILYFFVFVMVLWLDIESIFQDLCSFFLPHSVACQTTIWSSHLSWCPLSAEVRRIQPRLKLRLKLIKTKLKLSISEK